MTASRHTPFSAVVSAQYLAAHAPAAVGAIAARLRISVRLPAFPPRVPSLRIDVAMVVIAIVAVVGAGLFPRGEPNLPPYPIGALSSLPPGRGLVNHYDWGGFLVRY